MHVRLCDTVWKEPIRFRYQAVILLMVGFYQLRVRKKTICKRHNIIGYHKWLTDAGVVASGKLDVIMKNEAINVLFSQIMDDTVGTEAKVDICFIKNDSLLLALVSAARENNFK